jgi:hypothetical protein
MRRGVTGSKNRRFSGVARSDDDCAHLFYLTREQVKKKLALLYEATAKEVPHLVCLFLLGVFNLPFS